MNQFRYPQLLFRVAYRLVLKSRWIFKKPICNAFGSISGRPTETTRKICVINLDRQISRWDRMQRELKQVYNGSGTPLIEFASRFSAIDARDLDKAQCIEMIETYYSLADQLYVEPLAGVAIANTNIDERIRMTRQEVAVALSHIEVWKMVASGENEYVLVLEDDVCFSRRFAQLTNRAWNDLRSINEHSNLFDILYLSYKEVKTGARKADITDSVFKLFCGVWQLSGYVLSKSGAEKLLSLAPIRGPVDLWINHQFERLNVFATSKSVIDQRLDNKSDNSYSILPALSKIGILMDETPSVLEACPIRKPVFVFGTNGTGMSSLAMALSMLGYRCCNDLAELPGHERECLFSRSRNRIFDAYVNIGSCLGHYDELASIYPDAVFIIFIDESWIESKLEKLTDIDLHGQGTLQDVHKLICRFGRPSDHLLIFDERASNEWRSLCNFLECNQPLGDYPRSDPHIQRKLAKNTVRGTTNLRRARKLQFDTLPWIIESKKYDWVGFYLEVDRIEDRGCFSSLAIDSFQQLDESLWQLRNDTFPSNLAMFKPINFLVGEGQVAKLTLQRENLGVRNYSSASICTKRKYLYGEFGAVIKASNAPGVITGLFLHRNSPRQEIDIEILGKDTTKILLNVYYNPGSDGAKLEYGYRGTPVLVDLGFDASDDYHQYRIEWYPGQIRWFVDNLLIYERFEWGPTPIPHLPMQFHVNLWPSRSVELSGRLADGKLPASTSIKAIHLKSNTRNHES